MILYPGFDGVQHHDDIWLDLRNRPSLRGEGTLFEYADRLAQVLAPYPDVNIVLSTTWVRVKRFSYAVERLLFDHRTPEIGATWHSRLNLDDALVDWWLRHARRYEQIDRDVRQRQLPRWLAVDDDAEGWPRGAVEHSVRCDPQLGLSESRVRMLLEHRLAQLLRMSAARSSIVDTKDGP